MWVFLREAAFEVRVLIIQEIIVETLFSCTSGSSETTIANINKNKQNKTKLKVPPISGNTFSVPVT